MRILDASPTPIPWPELFTSLQTGVVEGTKNGITDIMGMKFPDAGLQYLTLDGHAYMGALWFMNNERFMSMPDDLKRVVLDGFYQLQQATFASPKRKSIAAYEEFAAGGGDLYVPTPEQKEAFREAASPIYDWFNANVDGRRGGGERPQRDRGTGVCADRRSPRGGNAVTRPGCGRAGARIPSRLRPSRPLSRGAHQPLATCGSFASTWQKSPVETAGSIA